MENKMERKIKTLNEVLNLNRRPTLQEMVDLSVEDYVKYLYCEGIIKYMPESGDLWDYMAIDDKDYHVGEDIIFKIKDNNLVFDDEFDDEDVLSEEKIIEAFNGQETENGILYGIYGKNYHYFMEKNISENGTHYALTIYEVKENGTKIIKDYGYVNYLKE